MRPGTVHKFKVRDSFGVKRKQPHDAERIHTTDKYGQWGASRAQGESPCKPPLLRGVNGTTTQHVEGRFCANDGTQKSCGNDPMGREMGGDQGKDIQREVVYWNEGVGPLANCRQCS